MREGAKVKEEKMRESAGTSWVGGGGNSECDLAALWLRVSVESGAEDVNDKVDTAVMEVGCLGFSTLERQKPQKIKGKLHDNMSKRSPSINRHALFGSFCDLSGVSAGFGVEN